ncbi:MAG: sulfurtransferase TusA family protein [Euryarchaeota archaeon]|nr:sulfurtransferase TusA family protein [Euryarchaeota archaeon]
METADLRGVKCPYNFIKSKKIMDQMKPGDTVEIIITDTSNLDYIRDYAKKKQIQFSSREEGGATRLQVKKEG